MDNKQQPDNIKKILDEKYLAKKISDEFGWIGEYSLSVKDILDIIIDLPTHAEIAQVPDKVPSAEEYLKTCDVDDEHFIGNKVFLLSELMESYALLREQRAVEVNRKQIREDVMITFSEYCQETTISDVDYENLRTQLLKILNNE